MTHPLNSQDSLDTPISSILLFIKRLRMFKRLPQGALDILDADYLNGYDLLVTFDNGEQRIWNASKSMLAPRALPYRSIEEFKKFHITPGHLYWGNDDFHVMNDSIYDYSFPFRHGHHYISAFTESVDNVEKIKAYFIKANQIALRLARSESDKVPIDRSHLIGILLGLSATVSAPTVWRDAVLKSTSYTGGQKRAVKINYENYRKAIIALNSIIRDINSHKIPVIWQQPDSGALLPLVSPIPNS